MTLPIPNISSSSSASQANTIGGPVFGAMPDTQQGIGSDSPLLWIAAIAVAGIAAYFAFKR